VATQYWLATENSQVFPLLAYLFIGRKRWCDLTCQELSFSSTNIMRPSGTVPGVSLWLVKDIH